MKNGDTIEVTVNWIDSVGGSRFNMVHNYRVTATAGTLKTWLNDWVSTYATALEKTVATASNLSVLGLYPTTVSAVQAVAFNLNTPTESASATLGKRGTAATQSYNPRAATLISLVTGVRGRSYRGRLYYPAPGESMVDAGGTLSENANKVLTAFAAAIKVLGSTQEQGIITVYSRKLSTPDIVFNTAVTELLLRGNLASQRRRRRQLS